MRDICEEMYAVGGKGLFVLYTFFRQGILLFYEPETQIHAVCRNDERKEEQHIDYACRGRQPRVWLNGEAEQLGRFLPVFALVACLDVEVVVAGRQVGVRHAVIGRVDEVFVAAFEHVGIFNVV